MKSPIYQWIGQMLAATGVIMSLALVAWELKQSRDLGMAEISQHRATTEMELYGKLVDNEALRLVWNKLNFTSQQLTLEEIMLAMYFIDGWMQSKESIFYHLKLELHEVNEWPVHEAMIRQFVYFPCYVKHWQSQKQFYRNDFVELVDELWKGADAPDCPDLAQTSE
jgi:hypothetical protein